MLAIEDDFIGAFVVQTPVHCAVHLAPQARCIVIQAVQIRDSIAS
jgi:hypothetical protein